MGVLPKHNCEACHYGNGDFGCTHPEMDGDKGWWTTPKCRGFKVRQ